MLEERSGKDPRDQEYVSYRHDVISRIAGAGCQGPRGLAVGFVAVTAGCEPANPKQGLMRIASVSGDHDHASQDRSVLAAQLRRIWCPAEIHEERNTRRIRAHRSIGCDGDAWRKRGAGHHPQIRRGRVGHNRLVAQIILGCDWGITQVKRFLAVRLLARPNRCSGSPAGFGCAKRFEIKADSGKLARIAYRRIRAEDATEGGSIRRRDRPISCSFGNCSSAAIRAGIGRPAGGRTTHHGAGRALKKPLGAAIGRLGRNDGRPSRKQQSTSGHDRDAAAPPPEARHKLHFPGP
ncbi:hypothetical protein SAMN04515659_0548 [Dyella sp. 333MFSha]|nr:hypothetical protein SAMN04515659_0548 [Dyella sp. 333MFSha]